MTSRSSFTKCRGTSANSASINLPYGRLDRQMTERDSIGLSHRMTEGFSRLELKLDQVIDAPSRPRATTRGRSRPSKRRR